MRMICLGVPDRVRRGSNQRINRDGGGRSTARLLTGVVILPIVGANLPAKAQGDVKIGGETTRAGAAAATSSAPGNMAHECGKAQRRLFSAHALPLQSVPPP